MRSIESWLDRFARKHSRFGVPGLIKYIIIGNVAVFLLNQFSSGIASYLLGFWPGLVLRGQVWRLFTFLIVPETSDLFWFPLSMLFFYYMGTALEREWGTAKFTLFYFTGALLTVITGFLGGLAVGQAPVVSYTMSAVNTSMFLAFATLYPDAQVRIMFVLPVKAKWMAVLYVALILWGVVDAGFSAYALALTVPPAVASFLNYLLFFWSDVGGFLNNLGWRVKHRTSRQTMNFKAARKHVKEKKGYLHKCAVCGRTDTDNPGLEFRYCSKCNGYYCYCMDHINNHVHIQ